MKKRDNHRRISSKEFVGSEIRKWRKKRGLKSFELARLISVSQGSMSDIETAKSYPAFTTLCSLLIKTDINIIKLMTSRKQ